MLIEIDADVARPKRRQVDTSTEKRQVATFADVPERCNWVGAGDVTCGGAWLAIPGGVSCLLCGRDLYVGELVSHELDVAKRTLRPLPARGAHEDNKHKAIDEDKLGKLGGPHLDVPKEEMVARHCLRCERKFQARGKFNRVCGPCREEIARDSTYSAR